MDYLERKYSIENDDAPSVWDQLSFWSAPFGKMLLDNVPIQAGMKVLDLGCGAGFPAIELAQRLGNTAKLIGFDCWEHGIERAKWKAKWMDLNNIEFMVGDGSKMPFDDGHFNLIVSNLGINNFQNPEKALAECSRVLIRNGKLCLTTNLSGHFREFYKEFETTLKELDLSEYLPKLKEQEAHRGTDETIRELLENAGLSIVKMVRDRFQMRFVDGTTLLNHFLVVIGFLDGWRSFVPPQKEKAVFVHLEERLNKMAEWEGELKMTVPMLYVEALK